MQPIQVNCRVNEKLVSLTMLRFTVITQIRHCSQHLHWACRSVDSL